YASISLPDGARITSATAALYDNDTTSDLAVGIWRAPIGSSTHTELKAWESNGTPGFAANPKSMNHTYDSIDAFYYIRVKPTNDWDLLAGGIDLSFKSMLIEYTLE
ncbi:MAG: DUF3604 domain-containing protein, partial [Proteobacteria bacterium]|nr:DUF3604 domain-containing protein [Pseudomonadota bacterium]